MRTIIAIMMASVLWANSAYSQVLPPDDPNWEVVFQDTFPGTAVDTSKWTGMWPWNQRQYAEYKYWIGGTEYTDTITYQDYKPYVTKDFSNISIDSGICTITARREDYNGEVWNWFPCAHDSCNTGSGHGGCDTTLIPPSCLDKDTFPYIFTTGMLLTRTAYKYGYYEINMRVRDSSEYKQNYGIGPCFWMWYTNNYLDWSEIDIYEIAGEYSGLSNYHTTNVHYQKCFSYDDSCWVSNPQDTLHFNELGSITEITGMGLVFNNNFNRFSAMWLPDSISNYHNRTKYGGWNSTIDPSELIPMPMVVDIAFPTTNFPSSQLPDTNYLELPYDYEIDYVKVWQPKEFHSSDTTVNNFNPATFHYGVYKSLTFTGTNTVASGKNVILRSAEGFTFNGTFTIEAGAEFLADPTMFIYPEKVVLSKGSTPEPSSDSFYNRYLYKNQEP